MGSLFPRITLLAALAACSSSSPSSFGADASADTPTPLLLLPPIGSSGHSGHGGHGGSGGSTGGGDSTTGTEPGSTGGGATTSGHDPSTSSSSTSSGAPTTLTPGASTLDVTAAGMSRTAVLYVPASATSTSPLVIALHGDGDTDTNFVATSGLQTLADQKGFVLVAPQGITRNVTVDGMTVPDVDWDAYNTAAGGNIDLPLLEQLRTQLQATGEVDANRTFVFGYSQGGYMSFLYGLSDATVLSCAGVLAASSPFGGGAGDPLISGATRKIPVAMQIGTLDYAYSAAQATVMSLQAAGFPVQFNAIAGAGHVPIPGDISVPLSYCLGQTL